MAEILALPTAAPASSAATGLPVPLDGALPALATDPFAAFLASAQATPSVAPLVPTKLPIVTIAEDQPSVGDIEVGHLDDDAEDVPDSPEAAPVVDPAITPALAMLSALATPAASVPRPSLGNARSRPEIISLRASRTPPVATETATPAATTTAPVAVAAALTALATAPNVLPEAQATALPAQSPPAVQIAVATPPTDKAVEQAVAAVPTALPKANGAIPAETTAPPEAESAVAAETMMPVEARAASPIKPRPIEPRIARGPATDAVAVSEHGRQGQPAPTPIRASAGIVRDTLGAEPIIAPPLTVAADNAAPTAAPQAPAGDLLVQRQLIIADDGRWLDSLARDIARSASGETMHFRLEPVNLGSLTVAIAQSSDGTAIRMTAETHRARDLLVDAQPALVAEARANGLRISETHVDLSSGNRDGSGNPPAGGQQSFANGSAGQQSSANGSGGQQAMRQDGNGRRQPDLPTPFPNQTRSTDARAPARDSGERFA